MDVERLAQVIWRQRWVMVIGLLIALAGAYVATFKPGTLIYRQQAQWSSDSTLLVTQAGFPWGRTTLPSTAIPGGETPASAAAAALTASSSNAPSFADPTRFFNLAILYSSMVESDQVRNLIPQNYRTSGKVTAVAQSIGANGNILPLPLVNVTATGPSALAARALDQQAIAAFETYLASQQQANRISAKERVTVTTLNTPSNGSEVSGPGLLPGIAVLVLVLVVSLLVARKLEDRNGLRVYQGGVAAPIADLDAVHVTNGHDTPVGPAASNGHPTANGHGATVPVPAAASETLAGLASPLRRARTSASWTDQAV